MCKIKKKLNLVQNIYLTTNKTLNFCRVRDKFLNTHYKILSIHYLKVRKKYVSILFITLKQT